MRAHTHTHTLSPGQKYKTTHKKKGLQFLSYENQIYERHKLSKTNLKYKEIPIHFYMYISIYVQF